MMRRIVAAAVMSQVLGCSFALVSGPPRNHEQLPYVDCTTSKLGPILDTVWTGLQTLNLLTAAIATDQEWDDNFAGDAPFDRSTAIPLYGSLAALGIAGMYYGFSRTSRCKDAKQQLMIRSQGDGLAPTPTGTWPPPAPAPAPGTAPEGTAPAPGPGTWPPPAPAPTPAPAPDAAPPSPTPAPTPAP